MKNDISSPHKVALELIWQLQAAKKEVNYQEESIDGFSNKKDIEKDSLT